MQMKNLTDGTCTVVDRLAALLHARDIRSGDVVGVFTTNSPEMVVVAYALSKLGVVAALINTSLRGMDEIPPSIRANE